MRIKKRLAIAIMIALAASLYLFSGEIAVFVFSKIHNLKITYRSMQKDKARDIIFNDLVIIDQRKKIGFFAKKALIKPVINLSGSSVHFDMSSVNFVKNDTEETGEAFDSLSGLISMPFMTQWRYKNISGDIFFLKNRLNVKKFDAESDAIRLTFTGDIVHDNTVNGSIAIYFHESLTKKIPPELSSVILSNEQDGWKSLSVNLTGNYKTPSVQVSNKLFRLNIKSIKNDAR